MKPRPARKHKQKTDSDPSLFFYLYDLSKSKLFSCISLLQRASLRWRHEDLEIAFVYPNPPRNGHLTRQVVR